MKKIYFYDYRVLNLKNSLRLGIAEDNGKVCCVCFGAVKKQDDYIIEETSLIKETAQQLEQYFSKKRKVFNLPVKPEGTDFQVKVWNSLTEITYGETRSYKELAAMTGNPKACRAVGMANNRNPVAIIIPCHRVIGHDGSLTGYAGGLELKKQLLELEKTN